MTILEAALSYAQRGWMVFPCQPRSKVPYPGTRGVNDATTNEATIRAWWTRWPQSNVALACGKGSGICVVDVDVDAEKGTDGFKSLEEFQPVPLTLAQRTPRGGAHYLYKAEDTVRNKNNFRSGIDIRAEGYYIMLAPSVHPNGGTYEWENEGQAVTDFPENLKPQKESRPWENGKTTPPPIKKPEPVTHNDVTERARAYLLECEPAIQGASGHDALLWAARAMVVGFNLDDGTALSLLWNDYNPRCTPPWDRSKPSDVKDFERKVKEVRRTPGKPFGFLLDEGGFSSGDTADIEFGATVASALLASVADTPNEDEQVEILKPRALKKSASEYPEELLRPPGLVGELCEWMNATAGCYQPLLSMGVALTACGALFGRKVRDCSNGRTNIYMMGVAHSSAGKDHPYDCVQRLFNAAGASMMLGGRVTSDSAIEVALMEYPVKLLGIDEIGHFFASIKQAGGGTGSNSHLRSIVPMLMELYSSSGKLYIGKQRAEGEARRILQPHVCVWGNTAPDVFYKGISTAELRDGWLGRVITLISEARPKYKIIEQTDPPESLVQMVSAWVARKPPPPANAGDIRGACDAHQITVPTSPDAMAIFEAFRDEAWERMMACDKSGDDTQYLWGKALQQARTVALIVAAGERFELPEISGRTAQYAVDLIRVCVSNFGKAIAANVADSEWESEKQRIYKIVKKAGPAGISKMEVTRRTQSIRDRRVRNEYIGDLAESGKIIFKQNKHHPEARAGWLWALPWGIDEKDED